MSTVLVSVLSLFAHASAWTLPKPHINDGEMRMVLDNQEDMLFTGTIIVSGQAVHVVMDSGSFEFVLFSKNCSGCSDSATFFSPGDAADDLHKTEQTATQAYGSGNVNAHAAYASVQLGAGPSTLRVDRQLFWLADEVELDMPEGHSFGGIFGLGPPASALDFAEKDRDYMEALMPQMAPEEAGRYKEVLQGLEDMVKLEQHTAPFLKRMQTGVFSICLLPGFGSPGYIIFNDHSVGDAATSWVDVTGGGFWEVPITNASIGDMMFDQTCSAVMDSGTSLIGLPEHLYRAVVAEVRNLVAQRGCEDISSWPHFDFSLGEQSFSLDPASYVGMFDFEYYYREEKSDGQTDFHGKALVAEPARPTLRPSRRDIIKKAMPHIEGMRSKHHEATLRATEQSHGTSRPAPCGATVFSMGAVAPDEECQFLFGLPFFRQFYVSHKIDPATRQAKKMAFSTPNDQCEPVSGRSLRQEAAGSGVPVVVKPMKLRFPGRAAKHFQSQWARSPPTSE